MYQDIKFELSNNSKIFFLLWALFTPTNSITVPQKEPGLLAFYSVHQEASFEPSNIVIFRRFFLKLATKLKMAKEKSKGDGHLRFC